MIRRILAIVLACLVLVVGLPIGAAVATETGADNTVYDASIHSYDHGLLLASSESEPAATRGVPRPVPAAEENSVSASHFGVAANAGAPVGRRVVTKTFTGEAGNVASQAKYGWEMKVAPGTNSPAVVGGRSYSGHALDQMQGRGIVPSAVDDAIGYGASAPSRGGTTVYYSSANDLSVVVNSEGRVVTTSFGDLR